MHLFIFASSAYARVRVSCGLYAQMEALRQARQEEVAMLEHEFEKAGKQRKKLESELQQREEETAELRHQIASLTRKLQRQAQKNRRIARRVIRSASAFGRSSRRTVCQELRTMRVGGVVEMLTKSTNRRPEPRYVKVGSRYTLFMLLRVLRGVGVPFGNPLQT